MHLDLFRGCQELNPNGRRITTYALAGISKTERLARRRYFNLTDSTVGILLGLKAFELGFGTTIGKGNCGAFPHAISSARRAAIKPR